MTGRALAVAGAVAFWVGIVVAIVVDRRRGISRRERARRVADMLGDGTPPHRPTMSAWLGHYGWATAPMVEDVRQPRTMVVDGDVTIPHPVVCTHPRHRHGPHIPRSGEPCVDPRDATRAELVADTMDRMSAGTLRWVRGDYPAAPHRNVTITGSEAAFLSEWQAAHGLHSDGVLGPQSWAALAAENGRRR